MILNETILSSFPDDKYSRVISNNNKCEVLDEGGEYFYSQEPAFFDKYFKSISCKGLFRGGTHHVVKLEIAFDEELLSVIPATRQREIRIQNQKTCTYQPYETYVNSYVTKESLSKYRGSDDYTIGQKVTVSTNIEKQNTNFPYSIIPEDVLNATFDSTYMKSLENQLAKVLQEYEKYNSLNQTRSKEITSIELIRRLIVSKFGRKVNVLIGYYGIPSKYTFTPRQTGSRFSDTIYSVDDKKVKENGYNLFVEVVNNDESLAQEINSFVNSLNSNSYINNLDIHIDSISNGNLENNVGYRDNIILGFNIKWTHMLLVSGKTLKLSDITVSPYDK